MLDLWNYKHKRYAKSLEGVYNIKDVRYSPTVASTENVVLNDSARVSNCISVDISMELPPPPKKKGKKIKINSVIPRAYINNSDHVKNLSDKYRRCVDK